MLKLKIEKEFMTCTKCNETYPATEEYFYKQKVNSKTNGSYYKLAYPCKVCRKKDAAEYTKNHMEMHDKSMEKYFKTQKYKQHIKGKMIRSRNYQKQWRKENAEKLNEYGRLRSLHKTHMITKEEINKLYKYCNGSCMYCGMTEDEHKKIHKQRLHRDHAVNNGSNGIDNCVLACKSCNVSKRDNDWFTWYTPENDNYNEDRYIKIKKWLESFANEKSE